MFSQKLWKSDFQKLNTEKEKEQKLIPGLDERMPNIKTISSFISRIQPEIPHEAH
jgi:hypothetical protein